MLGRFKLELVSVRGLPELLIALSETDEPGLGTSGIGVD